MQTLEERISKIEEEIRKTPYHKATEHHIGKLKARIARLRQEILESSIKSSTSGAGYAVKKTGDATVVLVGPPSVGKSTLLNKLTNASSKVAAYDFTTVRVIPGIMDYKGAKIQIFDVPGIIAQAALGKGRGKQILSVARIADLLLIMVDVNSVKLIPLIINELYEAGIRLNEEKPNVSIIKKKEGGIKVTSTVPLSLSLETIKSLSYEFRFANGEIIIREALTLEKLIDAFLGNRVFLPYLIAVNKNDLGVPKDWEKYAPAGAKVFFVSAERRINLELLKENIWQTLGLIRVYLKKENIDYHKPFILKKGKTLSNLLDEISVCTKDSFKKAKIFGPGAKFPGQEVSLSFVPQDETVVQFFV